MLCSLPLFFVVSCKDFDNKSTKSNNPIDAIETLSNDVYDEGDEWEKEEWDDAADLLENALDNLPRQMTKDEETIVSSAISRMKVYGGRHRRKASGLLEALEKYQPQSETGDVKAETAPVEETKSAPTQPEAQQTAQPAVPQPAAVPPPPPTTTNVPPVAGLLPAHVIREGGYTNVRKGPGTNYAIVTKVKDGSAIYYTNYNANWCQVYNTAGQLLGFMHTSKVITSASAPAPAPASTPRVATGTIYDWLSQRYVTEADIRNYDRGQLKILRNSIYARHYRKFKDAGLRQYFNSQQWYDGYRDEIPANELNKYEKYNIQFIQKYE